VIYAVVNQKGGVGKTTTAVNVAAALGRLGRRTLLIDLDPQANATSGVGVRDAQPNMADVMLDGRPVDEIVMETAFEGLWLAPGSPDLAGASVILPGMADREHLLQRGLASAARAFDVVIIDCAPSLDLLTINALTAADRLIVPVQCEFYALEGLSRLMETVTAVQRALNPDLQVTGMLMTMHDPRTRISGEVIAEVRRHFGDLAFRTVVPRNVRLAEAPSHGRPVSSYDPASAGTVAYGQLAREVLERD